MQSQLETLGWAATLFTHGKKQHPEACMPAAGMLKRVLGGAHPNGWAPIDVNFNSIRTKN